MKVRDALQTQEAPCQVYRLSVAMRIICLMGCSLRGKLELSRDPPFFAMTSFPWLPADQIVQPSSTISSTTTSPRYTPT